MNDTTLQRRYVSVRGIRPTRARPAGAIAGLLAMTVSVEHVRDTGSLNNRQARPNKDGTYTYVIAARDPGVHNSLSTGGLHEGQVLIRWQAFQSATAKADGALRSSL
jgi:hypothetical protein